MLSSAVGFPITKLEHHLTSKASCPKNVSLKTRAIFTASHVSLGRGKLLNPKPWGFIKDLIECLTARGLRPDGLKLNQASKGTLKP